MTEEERHETFVVIGNHYWGKGDTLVAAKARFRAEGGRLSDGYGILVFDKDTKFLGVDQMGYYSYDGNEPTVTTVKPKEKK